MNHRFTLSIFTVEINGTPAVALQAEGEAFYFIANYHALTSVRDPEVLRQNSRQVAIDFLACGFDPERASLSTWLTIVARSTARDGLRRRRAETVPLDSVPEAQLAIDPFMPVEKLKLPEALLSPRQREILAMLYDREMDVAEIARALGIDPQTVRSAHHKAMVKLRAHFRSND